MPQHADIGLIGLAVMGQNLALNMRDHGYAVAVYNRTTDAPKHFVAGERPMPPSWRPPRSRNWSSPGAAPQDHPHGQGRRSRSMPIIALVPLLDAGDVIIDGGNSFFEDTISRTAEVDEAGLLYIGTGVSGGEEGARHGPSHHARRSAARVAAGQGHLQAIAAKVADGTPCCEWVGAGWRRALREDGAQRHRVRRHAGDRRGLRPHAPRSRDDATTRCAECSQSGTGAASTATSSRSPPRSWPTGRTANRSSRSPRHRRPEGHRAVDRRVGPRGSAMPSDAGCLGRVRQDRVRPPRTARGGFRVSRRDLPASIDGDPTR